jgi:hypothetical protein
VIDCFSRFSTERSDCFTGEHDYECLASSSCKIFGTATPVIVSLALFVGSLYSEARSILGASSRSIFYLRRSIDS